MAVCGVQDDDLLGQRGEADRGQDPARQAVLQHARSPAGRGRRRHYRLGRFRSARDRGPRTHHRPEPAVGPSNRSETDRGAPARNGKRGSLSNAERNTRVSSPAKITAILAARPGKAEELKALLVGMAPHCRAEPGNLRWDVWQDESQSDRFVTDELYRDDSAVTAHHQTPHYQDYRARIGDIADRTALVLGPFAVEQTRS